MKTRSLVCALMFAVITGCGSDPKPATTPTIGPPPPTAGGNIRIAVIPKGTTHEFWKSIHAGAEKAASELGVSVIWKGPLKEDNREDQIKTVEDFITDKVSGIVLAPLDDQALVEPVKQAASKGIPVVIIDSGLKSDAYTSFVATNNKEGGRKGGKRLGDLLGGKGKVVMLRYAVGSASTTEREAGFMEAIKAFKDIEVVSENQYGGATRDTALSASENLLQPFKKDGGLSIDGIFCPNESTTSGMLLALRNMKAAGKVKFVGFDSTQDLLQAVKADEIHGLVIQNPFNMGYLGVKTLVSHIKGEKVTKETDTGSNMVTKENMEQPEIKEILTPDLKKWLKE